MSQVNRQGTRFSLLLVLHLQRKNQLIASRRGNMQMQTLTVRKKRTFPPGPRERSQFPAGSVFRVSCDWIRADYWGMIKSRIGAFRMNYAVTPGLYAVGDPTGESDVFVTANYKLTFDILRRALKGMNAWVLVLDTKSINVWCAAGKGTFGTDELVKRIAGDEA